MFKQVSVKPLWLDLRFLSCLGEVMVVIGSAVVIRAAPNCHRFHWLWCVFSTNPRNVCLKSQGSSFELKFEFFPDIKPDRSEEEVTISSWQWERIMSPALASVIPALPLLFPLCVLAIFLLNLLWSSLISLQSPSPAWASRLCTSEASCAASTLRARAGRGACVPSSPLYSWRQWLLSPGPATTSTTGKVSHRGAADLDLKSLQGPFIFHLILIFTWG